jgi:hypothetical protein
MDPKSSRRKPANTPADRMKSMLIFNGISSLMALTSAIVLYATYLGRPEAKWSIYMAGALCSVIAIHQMINFFFALELKRKFGRRGGGKVRGVDENSGGNRVSLLAADTGELVEAPSVTESTTELLDAAPSVKDPRVSNRA